MKKYKICVYAIAKNEEKFVDRFMDSVKDADYVVVLDTGSTDRTVKKLKKRGAIIKKKIFKNFRFDIARNESLKLIPKDTDICFCIDLDEVLETGWREKLENIWNENIKRVRYKYIWSFNPDGSEGVVFMADKIHAYNQFIWTHPVHEILESTSSENYITLDLPELCLKHYPDNNKSRSSYLPLLELSVKENPDDDRNMHYLGREYMFHKKYDEAISTLKKHLLMPSANWNAERCASMRFIAKCYIAKENYIEAKKWLYKAINEAPDLREPYIELAFFLYSEKNWYGCIFFINEALKITNKLNSYITDPIAWGSIPYDLLSISYFNLDNKEKALFYCNKALEIAPYDERLKNNLKYIKNTSNL